MVRRETQTPTYWHNFHVSESDLEQITGKFIMGEQPQSVDEIALLVMRHRCALEDALIKRELAKGILYQPKNSYQVGQALVFPDLSYAVGEIVDIRRGNNPEYGEFQVAKLQFEGQKTAREFAIALTTPHRLSYDGETIAEDGILTPDELYEFHGAPVRATLEAFMEESDEFVRLAGRWFLKSLLIEINIGHLNLAEALLDMSDGGPLPTKTFLDDLDLPTEIDEELRVFSLNYMLSQDRRFDEVGPAGQILWFLRSREPEPVLNPPRRLHSGTLSYDRTVLDDSLLLLEQELGDEWSEPTTPVETGGDHLTVTLTYPHRRVGTLPLTPQLQALFPVGRTHRIRFLFKDGTTGETWPGWVVHRHRYVFGLDRWYEANQLPAGAFIELRKLPEPGVVEIDYRRRRSVRDWVRVAVPGDGRISFEMRKRLVNCDYDELMIVTVSDPVEVDRIWKQAEEKRYPVTQVLYDIFPELSKLNPQGTVHAKTLYSAVNVFRRLPPGPIFAILAQDAALLPVGDNYWLFAPGS